MIYTDSISLSQRILSVLVLFLNCCVFTFWFPASLPVMIHEELRHQLVVSSRFQVDFCLEFQLLPKMQFKLSFSPLWWNWFVFPLSPLNSHPVSYQKKNWCQSCFPTELNLNTGEKVLDTVQCLFKSSLCDAEGQLCTVSATQLTASKLAKTLQMLWLRRTSKVSRWC